MWIPERAEHECRFSDRSVTPHSIEPGRRAGFTESLDETVHHTLGVRSRRQCDGWQVQRGGANREVSGKPRRHQLRRLRESRGRISGLSRCRGPSGDEGAQRPVVAATDAARWEQDHPRNVHAALRA